MFLAMYYNGYIIICIQALSLELFIFSWDAIGAEQGAEEDPTVCGG
jgi:hypothetical protein